MNYSDNNNNMPYIMDYNESPSVHFSQNEKFDNKNDNMYNHHRHSKKHGEVITREIRDAEKDKMMKIYWGIAAIILVLIIISIIIWMMSRRKEKYIGDRYY